MKKRMDSTLPFADAAAVWHLSGLNDSTDRNKPLTVNGRVDVGVQLTGPERQASLDRGGDGGAASFDGNGWLSTGHEPEHALSLSQSEEMSVCIRLRATKPGGLFYTNLFSLVVHDHGVVIGLLGVRSEGGGMYREIPLGIIAFNDWHDLIVRYRAGNLEFFSDGTLMASVLIKEKPQPIFSGPGVIGGWRVNDPPLPNFPQEIADSIFQRLFTGAIDHVAFWSRALADDEVALLSGVASISKPAAKSAWQKCMDHYRRFHDASRAKDLKACEALGLAMRTFMASDPLRPIYHLTAPMGWIADPVGAFYHEGTYHVFSFRNLYSELACCPLTHYASDDMIHWKDLPVAVWADSELDVHGIWLGNNFLDDQGIPAMLYTAHGMKGSIGALARSYDHLVTFGEKQAVITDLTHHDGHTWKDGQTWYTLVTSQYWGKRAGKLGDAITILTSPDLVHWTNRGELFAINKFDHPADDLQKWGFTEFPYLIPFGEKHVLMIGTRPVRYWVGRFDKEKLVFVPDDPQCKLIDYLNPCHCFNPLTVDPKGPDGSPRRIIYASDNNPSGQAESLMWNGAQMLPRVLTLEGGRLLQEPVPEAETLRGSHYSRRGIAVAPGMKGLINDVSGDALEIMIQFEPGTAKRFGLKVRMSGDGQTFTTIFYDVASGDFGVENNIWGPAPHPDLGRGPAYLAPGKPVTLRVFLDKCLLEVFVNGHSCTGLFKTDPKFIGLDLFSEGGTARVNTLDLWNMKPAWPLDACRL